MLVRNKQKYPIDPSGIELLKEKVLLWCEPYNTFSFLDNNLYSIPPNRYELLVGVQCLKELNYDEIPECQDWVFGQLDFEFSSKDHTTYNIFVPETVLYILHDEHSELWIESLHDPDMIFKSIVEQCPDYNVEVELMHPEWTGTEKKEDYFHKIDAIRNDIYHGQYYEINYCVRTQAQVSKIDPTRLFLLQKKKNPSPLSSLFRYQDDYILCQSPERFLYRDHSILIAQPIKGTSPRGHERGVDESNKMALSQSTKDQAENVMIVDLTRNDFYRCCEAHSVEVPELFGIYSFPFVHQMISTIRGVLPTDTSFNDIINVTYPMGSMTGAPKKAVIDHIKKYEMHFRKHYSGTIFYINPDGDFDSNVVIRSLFYNSTTRELSFFTGGAITYDSTAESEWNEILTKSHSMRNI